jgi:hypothetical protein
VGVAGLICAHLYLLVLPQAASYYLGAERAGIGYGYSTPGGFLGEAVRGLRIGFVGTAGLAVAGLVCLAGLASYLRQSLIGVVALFAWIVYPALAVLLHLGLYPRFFLFALPLGILLAVRGLHVLADWFLGRFGREGRIPGLARRYGWVALGLAGVLVSMAPLGTLYRVPKQDFSGALAYAEQVKQPDDQIVAVNLAGPVYRNYYRPDLAIAEDVDDLQALRRQGHTLWLIYIFPEDMAARFPELYRLITSQGQPVRRFPGLIGNGEVYVSRMAPGSEK